MAGWRRLNEEFDVNITSCVFVTDELDSFQAGSRIGSHMLESIPPEEISAILIYATIRHNQSELVRGVRQATGSRVPLLGCSTQGIVSQGQIRAEGYVAAGIALGKVEAAVATQPDIDQDTYEKGRALGRELHRSVAEPKLVVLLYDPLCGTDMFLFQAGLEAETGGLIIGGGASQPHGPIVRTFQYCNDDVLQHSAVALALGGDFGVVSAVCHGTSPVGLEMTAHSDGTTLLELGGRPALDIWLEMTGAGPPNFEHSASLAIGVLANSADPQSYLVRAAFGADNERKGIIVGAGLPAESTVMLHHRTVQGVLDGTMKMGQELAGKLVGKQIRAVLGFECAARTQPFLGRQATLQENLALQEAVGNDVPWLGLLAWGELYPVGGHPNFHNYTYPIAVITD